jgi:hypothetical protein
MKKSLDMFPAAELLPETRGLQPLVLESLPERTSTRHFHCTACFGMTAEVCTECVVSRELVASEAANMDRRRLQMLQKRKRPAEWRSVGEVLDRWMWMDTTWDWHICQWASSRFGTYRNLVQLKYFGWSCDFEAQELDAISDQSYEDAWRDLDDLCGGLFSGRIQPVGNAAPDDCSGLQSSGAGTLPGKRFLYVGDHVPARCFREWGFQGVRLPVAAGRTRPDGAAWDLRGMSGAPSRDEVPWPRTRFGAVQLWPDGEADEAVFDLIVLDEPPTRSALVQGFLAFFLTHLRSGGALAVKLSSLPKCKALTPLWHLVRIFGCGSVRLKKPGLGPEVHRSSFYVICRNFPGAGVPSLRDLGEVSNALLHSMSREAEVEGMDLPPMPTCIPTSPIVLVRNLCALLEAISRDAKPIWTKQYLALRSNLLVMSAQPRPSGLSPRGNLFSREGGLKRRKARQSREGTAVNESRFLGGSRTWGTSLSNMLMRTGIKHVYTILILVLWIAVNFCFFYPMY